MPLISNTFIRGEEKERFFLPDILIYIFHGVFLKNNSFEECVARKRITSLIIDSEVILFSEIQFLL